MASEGEWDTTRREMVGRWWGDGGDDGGDGGGDGGGDMGEMCRLDDRDEIIS